MNQNTTNTGIGFVGVLIIALIILKLLGVINWSWLWVLSPIWISFLIALLILILVVIAMVWSHK